MDAIIWNFFPKKVLDIFLFLKLREIQVVEEEKARKLTHKEKMKLSRTDRKVWIQIEINQA